MTAAPGSEHVLDCDDGDPEINPQVLEEACTWFGQVEPAVSHVWSRCEQRSPEDNFGFINRYLERMEPCIVDSAPTPMLTVPSPAGNIQP